METFGSVMTSVDLTFVNRNCTVPSSVVISTLASVGMLLLQKTPSLILDQNKETSLICRLGITSLCFYLIF